MCVVVWVPLGGGLGIVEGCLVGALMKGVSMELLSRMGGITYGGGGDLVVIWW